MKIVKIADRVILEKVLNEEDPRVYLSLKQASALAELARQQADLAELARQQAEKQQSADLGNAIDSDEFDLSDDANTMLKKLKIKPGNLKLPKKVVKLLNKVGYNGNVSNLEKFSPKVIHSWIMSLLPSQLLNKNNVVLNAFNTLKGILDPVDNALFVKFYNTLVDKDNEITLPEAKDSNNIIFHKPLYNLKEYEISRVILAYRKIEDSKGKLMLKLAVTNGKVEEYLKLSGSGEFTTKSVEKILNSLNRLNDSELEQALVRLFPLADKNIIKGFIKKRNADNNNSKPQQ